jgi:hypothetical protein
MKMSMGLSLEMFLECTYCKKKIDEEHEKSSCPKGQIAALVKSIRSYPCPECGGTVELNTGDFFECRSCHTQFSAGEYTGEGLDEDASSEGRTFILDMNYENRAIPVYVMKNKGEGKFRIDQQVALIKKAYGLKDEEDDD